mmetsp:Transcript_19087/g.42137  ORF Transcript_19087/g.42137 Transcript_19087/m.42137 type:complete len:300 (-) Transcript_19087:152-1051(-)
MYFAKVTQAVPPESRRAGHTLMSDQTVGLIAIWILGHINPGGFLQVPLHNGIDPLRQRGREEEFLTAFGGQLVHDGFDILLKTHGEHLVRLIQDQGFAGRQISTLSSHMIQKPPRGAHQNVNSISKIFALRTKGCASIETLHCQARCFAQQFKVVEDLTRKLPRGGNRHAQRGLFARLFDEVFCSHALHHWQHERESFSTASLGTSHHIEASEARLKSLLLDLKQRGDVLAEQSLLAGIRYFFDIRDVANTKATVLFLSAFLVRSFLLLFGFCTFRLLCFPLFGLGLGILWSQFGRGLG